MSKLSTIGQRVVPEAYQKMVEAGYLNEKLQITSDGQTMLFHIMLEENEKQFTDAADARIAARLAAKNGGAVASEDAA